MASQTGTLAGVPAPETLIPRAALTRFLRELPNYVVLRNEEDLFGNVERGGDIDLLVGDPDLAERTLIRHLGPPIRIIQQSPATQYFFDWGNIDLVRTIEWHGACYLPIEGILEGRRFSARGRPVPRLAHEAVIAWLTSPLWGGFFKTRYTPVIRQAVEADGWAFEQVLIEVAGNKWGRRLWRAAADGCPEISANWVQPLRRTVWWRACLRAPVRTIQRYLAFVVAELRRRFAPPVPWIAILGSDRQRKSAFASDIVDRLAVCPYTNVKAIDWCPPRMTPPQETELATSPNEGPGRRSIGSGLRLVVLAVNWLVNYWTRWVHLRGKGYVLVSDHTYFDLLVDPRPYGYRAGPRLARALSWLLPKPDLVFLLDSESDVLERRKEESVLSDLVRRKHAYRAFVRRLRAGHVLNESLPLSVLVDEVQRVLRTCMLEQSIATLGCKQNPIAATAAAVTAERSMVHSTWLGRGDAER